MKQILIFKIILLVIISFLQINYVSSQTTKPRYALLEVFTAVTCGPCYDGNVTLHNVLQQNSSKRYTVIKYQTYYPGVGDPYFTAEVGDKMSEYYFTGVPTLFGNGYENVTNPIYFTNSQLNSLQNVPAYMEINVDFYVVGHTVYAKA
ncbi:MAG: hypothetical protein FWH59_03050, partial [Lentimicrobiaceae bacterium]|nr:hypothetical protein [Lentimicrobiaceae bacterium]